MEKVNIHNQILQLEMYNHDIGFFFSSDLFESPCVKQLIFSRYTAHRPKKFCEIDEGIIFTSKDNRFLEICSSLEVDPKQTLLCYAEKKRKTFMAISDEYFVKTNTKPNKYCLRSIMNNKNCFNPSLELGINISETMNCILNELNKLSDKVLIKSTIDRANEIHHPACNTKYSECQLYIKVLSLFCCEFGLSVEQLFRLIEMSCGFGISSYHLGKLLEYICDVYEDTCKELIQSIINSASVTEKEVLLTDMLYMVFIGNYDIQTEFAAVESVGELLDANMDSVFMIYDQIKEI